MPAVSPFLRSPPFPGVTVAEAAVSLPGRSAVDDREGVFAALRGARVGGSFWGRNRPAGGRRHVVVGSLPRLLKDEAVAFALPDRDPWSLVAGAEALWSDEPGEIALVAWLSGVAVRRHNGSVVPGEALADRLAAALADAAYRNPFTGATWTVEQAIDQLRDWRRTLDSNRGIAATAGMAWWKRRQISRFLWDGERAPPNRRFDAALRAAGNGGAVAVWPSRIPADSRARAEAAGVTLVQVEDGFLRSRGLGSDLNLPWSVVVDRRGIYYRSDAASDLEHILATHPFPPELVARAAALRETLVTQRLATYGDTADAVPFERPAERRTVLAVGQVEDDLSVKFGGAGIDGNLAFLQRVRAAETDAFLVYRPHPDVLAGHRVGDIARDAALAHVDRIDAGGSVLAAIDAVDAVHVLSSLAGFEALLRGREVVVHGRPFYAGWGLTRDLARQNPARGRQLALDQLVAGAMIVYPRYLDPVTGLPCPPEVLVDHFAAEPAPAASWLVRLRRTQGRMRRLWGAAR